MQDLRVEISLKTVLQILLVLGVLLILREIQHILIIIFVAFIFMSTFNPWVDFLHDRGIARWIGAMSVVAFIILLVVLLLVAFIPPLLIQTQNLILDLPSLLERALQEFPFLTDVFRIERGEAIQLLRGLVQSYSREIVKTPFEVIRLGKSVADLLLAFVTMLFITFYFLLEHRGVKKGILFFLPPKNQREFHNVLLRVEKKLGAWLRGELILMFIIGLATYLGLAFLLHLPFAMPLAILAGLLEIVPVIGPVIATIPALFVAAAFSPWKVVSVILLYTLIQQLESNLIVPNVMKQAVGIDPLIILLAVLIGAQLIGPLGALLAVPVTAVCMIILNEYMREREEKT